MNITQSIKELSIILLLAGIITSMFLLAIIRSDESFQYQQAYYSTQYNQSIK